MPEGDSIHRARMRLEPMLAGEALTYFWAARLYGHAPRPGQSIEAVRAHGKHLFIDFDRSLTVDTHLGMNGSWRVTTDEGELTRSARNPRLRLIVSTVRGHALCFAAPEIRSFLRTTDDPMSRLGPDLTAPAPDLIAAADRARERPPTTLLTDLLLDQSVASGVGNIFKSETLFVSRLFPFLTNADLTPEQVVDLLGVAADLLSRNAQSADQQRSTTGFTAPPSDRFFVYRRWRRPCHRCGYPIERDYRGSPPRRTYWCPRCQRRP